MIANISWIIYDVYNGCYAQATLFCAYLAMNVYGLYCWKFRTSEPNKLKEFAEESLS
jgi:nicotinamide riboside transporter PnuC